MKHSFLLRWNSFPVFFLFLTSCSYTKVFSDYDHQKDFSQYKTYAWVTKSHPIDPIKELNSKRAESSIKKDVSHELHKRGFTLDTENPDLLFDFFIVVKDSIVYEADPTGYISYSTYNYSSRRHRYYSSRVYYPHNYYHANNCHVNTNHCNNHFGENSYPGRASGTKSFHRPNLYDPLDMQWKARLDHSSAMGDTLEVGSLVILVQDHKQELLIWKGHSVGLITDEYYFEEELHSDMRRLFKKFPMPIVRSVKRVKP